MAVKTTNDTSGNLTSAGTTQLRDKAGGTAKAGKKKGPKFNGMRMKVKNRLGRGTKDIRPDALIE